MSKSKKRPIRLSNIVESARAAGMEVDIQLTPRIQVSSLIARACDILDTLQHAQNLGFQQETILLLAQAAHATLTVAQTEIWKMEAQEKKP